MEVQEIDVFIDQDGQVRIEVRGVKGGACLDLTADLEQALGGQVQSRELTPEAREAREGVENQLQSRQTQRNG